MEFTIYRVLLLARSTAFTRRIQIQDTLKRELQRKREHWFAVQVGKMLIESKMLILKIMDTFGFLLGKVKAAQVVHRFRERVLMWRTVFEDVYDGYTVVELTTTKSVSVITRV